QSSSDSVTLHALASPTTLPSRRSSDLLGHDRQPLFAQAARRLDDRARLHLGDFRIRDAEADAAMAEHRVELVKLLDARQQRALRSEEHTSELQSRVDLGCRLLFGIINY